MADRPGSQGAAAGFSTRVAPAVWRARVLHLLALAFLLLLVLLPVVVRRHAIALEHRVHDLHVPSRAAVRDVEISLSRGIAALRGYLLTGDTAALERYWEAYREEQRAIDALMPLAHRFDPEVVAAVDTLRKRSQRWHAHVAATSHAPGEGATSLDDIETGQRIYTDVFEAVREVSRQIDRHDGALWVGVHQAETIQTVVTSILVLLLLIAVTVVSTVSARARRLAHRLGLRARQEHAFRLVARDLAAAESAFEVQQLTAKTAHEITRSRGAFVERFLPGGKEVEITATSGEGVPGRGTRVAYPGALDEEQIRTGAPAFRRTLREHGGPTARIVLRECGECGIFTLPLVAGRDVLGALVLIQPAEQPEFTPEEVERLRIVADFSSLALRRVILLEETERRRLELEESEQRYRSLFLYNPNATYELDLDGYYIAVNHAAVRLSGYREGELLGQCWLDHIVPEDRAEMERLFGLVSDGQPQHYEATGIRKDGSAADLLGTLVPIIVSGRVVGMFGISQDVTEQRMAEAELRRTTRTLSALIRALPLATIVTTPDGIVELWNPAAERLLGWSAREVVSKPVPQSMQERWPLSDDFITRILRGEIVTGIEFRQVNKSGEPVDVSVSVAPVLDPDGSIRHVISILEDIGERKRAEEERLRLLERERVASAEAKARSEQVRQLMENKSRLIRGFSHDLKNPLGALIGHAELLTAGIKGDLTPEQRESIERMRDAANSMLAQIEDLVELSRAEAGQLPLEHEPTDVAQLVREAVQEYGAETEAAGHTLELHLPDTLPEIVTDPQRVRQILGNLLSNAIKYTPRGGRVTVTVEERPQGGPGKGPWITIAVTDTGPGIPEDKQEALFTEFTRLDPESGRGSGLGLAISRNIARLLGGDITVRSAPDKGSTFTLWLPVTRPEHTA